VRTGRGSHSRGSQEQLLYGRKIEARSKVEGGAFVPRCRGWKCLLE